METDRNPLNPIENKRCGRIWVGPRVYKTGKFSLTRLFTVGIGFVNQQPSKTMSDRLGVANS